MSTTNYAATARSYSRTASAATRRAEREARQAEQMYDVAASKTRHARWLTNRPDLWDVQGSAPAQYEADARSFTQIGDIYLRGSFRATDSAEFYRGLAASYRDMAAREAARMGA